MNDGPEQPQLVPRSSVYSTHGRLIATLLVTVVGALVCAAAGVRVVAPGEAAILRLRQEALRDILLQCERVYYVTDPPAGGDVRVRVAPPRVTP